MNYLDKSKEELVHEIQILQQAYNSLTKVFSKVESEPHSDDIRHQVLTVFKKYMEVYFYERNAHKTFALFDEEMTVIGTGQDEIAFDFDAIKEFYLRDLSQAPNPISVDYTELSVTVLSQTLGLVNAVVSIKTHIENNPLEMKGLRISVVLRRANNQWRLIHKHVSLPAIVTPKGESYPLTELKEQNQWLEKKIKEKTQELVDINNELKKLNSDKDRFLSILAHDLRGPFNTILGFLDLLHENIRIYNIDDIEAQLNIINASAQNAFKLLEDILLWARAQSGMIPYIPQNLSLREICQSMVDFHSSYAKSKNITISYNALEDIAVFADVDMLKTILRNLISNAIKFTNTNGEVNIDTVKGLSMVTISVSDNGLGITEERAYKLFDISQTHTSPGTANETGTGLGLLLCKEFIDKHGGRIWVNSEIGKGTQFYFTLPCEDNSESVRRN